MAALQVHASDIKAVFRTWDVNNEGFISCTQLINLLMAVSPGCDVARLEAVLLALCRGNAQLIDYDAFCDDICPHIVEILRSNSGTPRVRRLSEAEPSSVMGTPRVRPSKQTEISSSDIKDVFHRWDVHREGVISFAQLVYLFSVISPDIDVGRLQAVGRSFCGGSGELIRYDAFIDDVYPKIGEVVKRSNSKEGSLIRPPMVSEISANDIKDVFRRWDAHGEGVMDSRQVIHLLMTISPDFEEDKLKSVLDTFCVGSAGLINYEALIDNVCPSATTPYVVHRPPTAAGTFLRVLMIDDVVKGSACSRMASAVAATRAAAPLLDCVVTAHINGSPCPAEALNMAKIDYACLGVATLSADLAKFHGIVLNSNIKATHRIDCHKFHTVAVGERTVVLGGYVSEVGQSKAVVVDASHTVVPMADATASVWEEATRSLNRVPDLFLPMTQQNLSEDLATGSTLASHPELGCRTPVILGKSEIGSHVDEAGKSMIVKLEEDMAQIGIIDIWWTAEGQVESSCTIVSAESFPEYSEAVAFAQR